MKKILKQLLDKLYDKFNKKWEKFWIILGRELWEGWKMWGIN